MKNALGRIGLIPVTIAAEFDVWTGRVVTIHPLIIADDAAGELVEVSSHRLTLADVGVRQAIGNDAADVILVFAEKDGLAEPGRSHGSGDSARSRAVDDDCALFTSACRM